MNTIKLLTFDEWCDEYQEGMEILFAETGADREMDFDLEKELNKKYDEYVDNIVSAHETSIGM